MIVRVKGTQDFLDLTLFNAVLERTIAHLHTYNFSQIATPIVEPLDLFVRSLGTQTDVVNKEMFIIESNKEEKICLRPEATASIMRAFVENGVQTTPWKVFLHGPMFRYEQPQKGRYRQFHQVSIEVIGSPAVAHDVQLITMLDRLFHEQFKINSYALLINFLGCYQDRKEYVEQLRLFLKQAGSAICPTCLVRADKNPMRVFDCKNEACQKIYKTAPYITDHICAACDEQWQQVQTQLALLSVSFVVKKTLVRGLDYYNKTVFEFVSAHLGAQNTFCAGGRYDLLAKEIGASVDQPSVGAALGIERLMLLLEPIKETLNLPNPPALQVIIPVAPEQEMVALLLADELLAAGFSTQVFLERESIKAMMRKANKLGATYALIIGDQEQESKTVTVKHMVTGEQLQIKQVELVNYLKNK